MSLTRLLERNRQLLPHYGAHYFSNHASMALVALDKMGADQQRLNQWFDYYQNTKQLQLAESAGITLTAQNWQQFLGKRNYYYDYYHFFLAQAQQKGVKAVLSDYLDFFMRSVACDAFHPMLRLAYALQTDVDNQVAEVAGALAYWADGYWDISLSSSNDAGAISSVTYLQLLHDDADLLMDYNQHDIDGRIRQVRAHPAFIERMQSHRLADDQSLASIADVLIDLYQQTEDFTLLHGVTSCHAMRVLLPFVTDKRAAIDAYWTAICAAYVTVGLPSLQPTQVVEGLDSWSDIINEAILCNDDHVIKLVYTCRQQCDYYMNNTYHQVAQYTVKSAV